MDFYSLEPANFSDYRSFLKERFHSLKKQNSAYSLQFLSQKSGVSKSHLRFLFKKERHISLDKFPPLACSLKLDDEEEYFVYLMICKNSSQNPRIQKHFEDILSRIRNQYIGDKQDESTFVEKNHKPEVFFSDLVMTTICNQMKILGFCEDPEIIFKDLLVPNLTKDGVAKIIKKLDEQDLLERDPEGRVTSIKENLLHRPDPYDPNGFKIYSLAADFLARLMKRPEIYKPSIYSSSHITLDEEHLNKLEKTLRELHHTIISYSKESVNPTTNVYVSNYFLTLSRLSTGKKHKSEQ